MTKSKRCSKCGNVKLLDAFSKNATCRDRRRPECKVCQMASNNARKYGLTLADVEQIRDDQRGRCAACYDEFRDTRNTHIDHCHITGKVRGLLCRACNVALGCVQDDLDRIDALRAYLVDSQM